MMVATATGVSAMSCLLADKSFSVFHQSMPLISKLIPIDCPGISRLITSPVLTMILKPIIPSYGAGIFGQPHLHNFVHLVEGGIDHNW
jgi:hypothetical protein